MSEPLTDRQAEVLAFIRKYTNKNGYPPSIREIGEAHGIASPNGMMCHIRALLKKGCLKRAMRNGRAIARTFVVVG